MVGWLLVTKINILHHGDCSTGSHSEGATGQLLLLTIKFKWKAGSSKSAWAHIDLPDFVINKNTVFRSDSITLSFLLRFTISLMYNVSLYKLVVLSTLITATFKFNTSLNNAKPCGPTYYTCMHVHLTCNYIVLHTSMHAWHCNKLI